MSYESKLRNVLLSDNNIEYIIKIILDTYKITNNAISKCKKFVEACYESYIQNISRLPNNDQELTAAINYLNMLCIKDFDLHLKKQYPNINLLRTQSPTNEQSTYTNQQPPSVDQQPIPVNGTVCNTPSTDIIILSEQEKINLVQKDNIFAFPVETKMSSADMLLSYLTNPMILEMICLVVNKTNIPQKPKFTKIIDYNELQVLLQNEKTIVTESSLATKNSLATESSLATKNSLATENSLAIEDSLAIDNSLICLPTLDKQENQLQIFPLFDCEQDFSIEKLTEANERVLLLKNLRKKYALQQNNNIVKQINDELLKIANYISAYKNKLDNEQELCSIETQDNESKNKLILPNNLDSTTNLDESILDLEFDPTNNYNDMRDIKIDMSTNKKIKSIVLKSYFVPQNSNNITRFSKCLNIYFNQKMYKAELAENKYTIGDIITEITKQLHFIEIIVSNKNIITIKNSLKKDFELITTGDTLLQILGFDAGKTYKDEMEYTAQKPYDIDCNDRVIFTLSGTPADPVELQTNKFVVSNIKLINSTTGLYRNQLNLSFLNKVDQLYDFMATFKMCFIITY